jgi:two-component system cell cycle response regulator
VLGKILIVDAIATNRIVLKVKLASAFYEVLQAGSVAQAVSSARQNAPDLVISAMSLPEGDGAPAISAALRADRQTQDIAVLGIAAKSTKVQRIAAFEAGVVDVLSKPVEDVWLLGRVRSLIRARNATAEWRLREDTSTALGMAEPVTEFAQQPNVMMVSHDAARAQGWRHALQPALRARISLSQGGDILRNGEDGAVPDAFVLFHTGDAPDGACVLPLISTLRSNAATRHTTVLVVQTQANGALAAQALDLGADDVMIDGFAPTELSLRLKALMLRKRKDALLRDTYRTSMTASMHDPLTGLHNRRYAMPHLSQIGAHAQGTGLPFAVMVADLDHFKRINDLYGHASGDAVLVEVAARLRKALRKVDLVARIGGEEFLIVMPATSPEQARDVAVRICSDISGQKFDVPGAPAPIQVTISIGMAISEAPEGFDPKDVACATLLDQADKALYSAKLRGRNRVNLGRPAA